MCYAKRVVNEKKNLTDTDSVVEGYETTLPLPEIDENPFVNRNIKTGILGFRCETKDGIIVLYTSAEAKTFCLLMKIKPVYL